MAKIDLGQIDEFVGVLPVIQHDESIKYDENTQKFVPYRSSSFGSSYQFEETPTSTITSSTVFQLHQTMTTPVIPAGSYLITWATTFQLENTASPELETKASANGVVLAIHNQRVPNQNNGQTDTRNKSMEFQQFDLDADGVIAITLEIRRQGSNKLVTVFDSRITLIRVA